MARRVPIEKAVSITEKRTYFSTEYGLKAKAGLELGKEVYLIPLGLDKGVYITPYHLVKARVDGKEGFHSLFDSKVICKGIDEEGNKNNDAVCCNLFNDEKEKHPEDYAERMISGTRTLIHIPVLILSNVLKEKDPSRVPATHLSIQTYDFSFLELSSKAWETNILEAFKTKLEEDEKIKYGMEMEEARPYLVKALQQTIIKITCVKPSGVGKYERVYSFVPFYNKNIGKDSGERQAILEYRKDKNIMKDIIEFTTLFDNKVDELVLDYKDDSLVEYIQGVAKRKENLETAIEKDKENNSFEEEEGEIEEIEEIVEKEDIFMPDNADDFSFDLGEPEKSEPELGLDEIEFDVNDDFFEDDIDIE